MHSEAPLLLMSTKVGTSQKTAGFKWLELGYANMVESHASKGFSRNSMVSWGRDPSVAHARATGNQHE